MASNSPGGREHAFLLCAIGADATDAKPITLHRLIDAGLDWNRLLARARRHRVAPLLVDPLNALVPERVPADIRSLLSRKHRGTLRRGVHLTGQLVSILNRFEAAGVRSLPFKGPTLNALAYADLGLRQSIDLDILVAQADIQAATLALVELGFSPRLQVDATRDKAFFEFENAMAFRRTSDGCLVELHWALTPKYLPFLADPGQVWNSVTVAYPAGRAITTLAPEPLLLFLCVHGAKHSWESLCWVADIARLITRQPTLRWEQLLSDAAAGGSLRMLCVGLLLARNLFSVTLPEPVNQMLASDPKGGAIAHTLAEALAGEDAPVMSYPARVLFHLQMRERTADKFRFLQHLALTPTVRDYELFRLPKPLTILYPPMRAVRLVLDYAGQGRRP